MTQAEAMDEVRRAISGTVVTFPHPIAPGREDSFLVGDRNAEVIMSALYALGWSWVLTRATPIGPRRDQPLSAGVQSGHVDQPLGSAKGKVSKGRGYPRTPDVR